MSKPFTLIHGDCVTEMWKLPANSVDAIVTDPPYGISFMGKAWDGADIVARTEKRRGFDSHAPDAGPNGGHKSIAAEAGKYDLAPAAMKAFQQFSEEWAREAFRVLKPGGHLLSFASARTYHRMTSGIEDAGFEIRGMIEWIFGSGFPKSKNLDGDWAGFGTALKPSHEPICMARKPLAKGYTVAANVLQFGTGALNIDGCRVPTNGETNPSIDRRKGAINHLSNRPAAETEAEGKLVSRQSPEAYRAERAGEALGRWPADLIHDGSDEVLAAFPDASGAQGRVKGTEPTANGFSGAVQYGGMLGRIASAEPRIEIETSAARFYYCAKASRADRNAGLENPGPQFKRGTTLRAVENAAAAGELKGNTHPTVKPTDLMAYLVRLVTPPGGVVLDPFMGSGSTGKAAMREGMQFIGIELETEYLEIATARIEHEHQVVVAANAPPPASPQMSLFGSAP